MINLEFRFQENFRTACRLLEAGRLPFESEPAREEWRPSVIWLFEDRVATPLQKDALAMARTFEQKDRFQQKHRGVLNLAMPQ